MSGSDGLTWLDLFFKVCPRHSILLKRALFYALCMSTCFVLSLYILVPLKIRKLDRDDKVHIKWRIFATTTAAIGCLTTFPLMVCSFNDIPTNDEKSAIQLLGINIEMSPVLLVLAHTCTLYTGAGVATVVQIHEIVTRQRRQGKTYTYFHIFKMICIYPILDPFWPQIRNLFTAPILEELVFRACMVPLLQQALGNKTTTIILITPLFFGVAHAHHAFLKWREKQPWKLIVLSSSFQLLYTTLFGAYATYVFLRTNSLWAIAISHQFCNYMGLPDLSFFRPQFGRLSHIHRHRWYLIFSYVLGFAAFICGFVVILP
mmetsp:Transcript_25242/g.38145  ORF Transcript_25242/g.38145 Transcript_25242/m.38145 type:complete len:317 (-) Transcript_25242:166-1116(-)